MSVRETPTLGEFLAEALWDRRGAGLSGSRGVGLCLVSLGVGPELVPTDSVQNGDFGDAEQSACRRHVSPRAGERFDEHPALETGLRFPPVRHRIGPNCESWMARTDGAAAAYTGRRASKGSGVLRHGERSLAA